MKLKLRVLSSVIVIVSATALPARAATYAADATFSEDLEGPLAIPSNSWISAGLIVRVPAPHPAVNVTAVGAIDIDPLYCDPQYAQPVRLTTIPNFRVAAQIPADDMSVLPTVVTADPVAFQSAYVFQHYCPTVYVKGPVRVRLNVDLDQPVPVEVAVHYRVPAAKGFADLSCADPAANPFPADPAPCDGRFGAFHSLTPPSTPVPMGALGGLGLAAILGAVLAITASLGDRTTVKSFGARVSAVRRRTSSGSINRPGSYP